ncbi:hypothetical protein LSAT2_011502 [Lamellibrachia satsuma]|nr:hypothetical protein LSAT2_011502 [Lamellibrachia satsuma]
MATVYNVNNTRVNSGDRYHASPPAPRETYRPSPTRLSDIGTESPVQVGFKEPAKNTDLYGYNERKKYLTAKYGQHQMRLIRKRLAVEDWVDEELRRLYDADEDDTYDCEIDLDELLDLDEETDRRLFVQERVANVTKSQDVVDKFIEDLLEKAQTL